MPSLSHIIDKEHGYAVRIPEQTPDGQTVSVETNTSENVHVLHAYSPDRSELYFEITTFPELLSHQVLAAAQQRFLSEHSTDG
ncbi:MAG: hypothetical protein KDI55_19035, partial [Anaerolineae bacterium]|nr:hypothetical protein [Anaerolineae bacterium]